VVFARGHDRQPLALARLGEAVLHLEAPRDLRLEAPVDLVALRRRNRVEGHAHEEAALVAGVLVGVDDVEPGLGEEAAHRRDQPRPVRTGEQQPRCSRLRDPRIIPIPTRITPPPTQTASNSLPAGTEI
jgi:hypothetical protein